MVHRRRQFQTGFARITEQRRFRSESNRLDRSTREQRVDLVLRRMGAGFGEIGFGVSSFERSKCSWLHPPTRQRHCRSRRERDFLLVRRRRCQRAGRYLRRNGHSDSVIDFDWRFYFFTFVVFVADGVFTAAGCAFVAFVWDSCIGFCVDGRRIWKEHIRFSSTLITPPALSNSPQ